MGGNKKSKPKPVDAAATAFVIQKEAKQIQSLRKGIEKHAKEQEAVSLKRKLEKDDPFQAKDALLEDLGKQDPKSKTKKKEIFSLGGEEAEEAARHLAEERERVVREQALKKNFLKEHNHMLQKLSKISYEMVDMIKGKSVRTETVVVDPETMRTKTLTDASFDLSFQERAQACEALWSFQYKGDPHKASAISAGAFSTCLDIISNPPSVPWHEKDDLELLKRNCLMVLRSLCTFEGTVEVIHESGITEAMLVLALDKSKPAEQALALDTLSSIASISKEERKQLVDKFNIMQTLFGERNHPEMIARTLLGSGLEACARAAFSLVEQLLTREATREYLMAPSLAMEVFHNVLEMGNDDLQAAVCRVLVRMCESDSIRRRIRKMEFAGPIADLFVNTMSPTAQAMACAALGNCVGSKDAKLAKKCLPRIFQVLETPKAKPPKQEQVLLELPGALRALRAFAKQSWVQDKVVERKLLPWLVEYIADARNVATAMADAAHVVGSVALQLRYHNQIMNLDRAPLLPIMQMIKNGDTAQKEAGARCLQYFSHNPALRTKVADWVFKKLTYDEHLKAVAERWDALDLLFGMIGTKCSSNSRSYASGALRNLAGLNETRRRVLAMGMKYDGPLRNLCVIVDNGSIPAKCHAAAALGNLCTDSANAEVVFGNGKIAKDLLALLRLTSVTDDRDWPFLAEAKENATITLSMLAFSDFSTAELMRGNFMSTLEANMSTRSPNALRLASAKALQNMSCFEHAIGRIAHQGHIYDAMLKHIKTDNENMQGGLAAVLSNLLSSAHHMDMYLTPRAARILVSLLRRGTVDAKHHAARAVKNITKSMRVTRIEILIKAGILAVLVPCMKVEINVEEGTAEFAACCMARIAATDEQYAMKVVDCGAMQGLVDLMGNGCEAASLQACKALLILAESDQMRTLILQMGGMQVASEIMRREDAVKSFAEDLIEQLSGLPQADHNLTIVEKKLAKRDAERLARVVKYRESQETVRLAAKSQDSANAFKGRKLGSRQRKRSSIASRSLSVDEEEFNIGDQQWRGWSSHIRASLSSRTGGMKYRSVEMDSDGELIQTPQGSSTRVSRHGGSPRAKSVGFHIENLPDLDIATLSHTPIRTSRSSKRVSFREHNPEQTAEENSILPFISSSRQGTT